VLGASVGEQRARHTFVDETSSEIPSCRAERWWQATRATRPLIYILSPAGGIALNPLSPMGSRPIKTVVLRDPYDCF
jgi:hypothetical protein